MKSLSNRIRSLITLLSIPILAVSLGCPPIDAAALTNRQQATLPVALPSSAEAPKELVSFAELTVQQLLEQEPFQGWGNAQLQFFPLGPGTHSWLVTLSSDQKNNGYLILAAKEDGGYILSEYGAGEYMPYQLSQLHQALQLTGSPQVEALYAPLLPVWKITYKGQAPVYIHAITMEELPFIEEEWEELSGSLQAHPAGVTTDMKSPTKITSRINSSIESDPYTNLTWITRPQLNKTNPKQMITYMKQNKSLVFTAPNRNAAYAAPFVITGFQDWSASSPTDTSSVYAATGQDGGRFLPFSMLIEQGELRLLTK